MDLTPPTPNIPLLRTRAVPLADRFWKYVEIRTVGECWPWTGRVNNAGYGLTSYTPFPGAKSVGTTATRAAWFLTHDEWPTEFMCHRCDNPPCVNPAHLFEGDQLANMRDAKEKGRTRGRFSDATHCIHGHEFTAVNTYVNPGTGSRVCRPCYRTYDKRRKAAQHV